MKKWRPNYSFSMKPIEMTAAEAIIDKIDEAPDYHDGAVEGCQRKVDTLSKIVAMIFEKLSNDDQAEILSQLGYTEVT